MWRARRDLRQWTCIKRTARDRLKQCTSSVPSAPGENENEHPRPTDPPKDRQGEYMEAPGW